MQMQARCSYVQTSKILQASNTTTTCTSYGTNMCKDTVQNNETITVIVQNIYIYIYAPGAASSAGTAPVHLDASVI